MNTDELFIDIHKLPKPLSKEEVYDLIDKMRQGNASARKKLAEHNIRLVLYEVKGKFKSVEYDKKDLVSIGNVGLMKAINTFDISKKVEFATYATRCIDNEILMFLKKIKKNKNVDSLDRTINHDKDGNELKVEDILSDDTDIAEEYSDNETYQIVRKIVNELPERDRDIVIMHFGFFDNKRYTQQEIAAKFKISQSYVSRLIYKIVKRLGSKLEAQELIELREKTERDSKKCSVKQKKKEKKKWQKNYKQFMNILVNIQKNKLMKC